MLSKLYRSWRGPARARRVKLGRDGFSLVEILMVLLILSVGVLPIALIQHRSRREVNEADRHTQAIAVAQAQLERLKSMGFGNIPNDAGQTGNINWAAQVVNVGFGLDRIDLTTTWQTEGGVETLVVSDLISMR